MNGRSVFGIICALFVIGIVWMIAVAPEGETTKTASKLFEPMTPIPEEVVVSSALTTPSEQKEATPAKEEKPRPSEKKEPGEKKPKPKTPQAVSDEPPEMVEYTPKYGRVTFTHMMHVEDYEFDCGTCHHEDMEGGMSKCTNCHEPPKKALDKNCQGCHKELKNEGRETGPVKCRECHIKQPS